MLDMTTPPPDLAATRPAFVKVATEPDRRARLRLEAMLLRQAAHPGVVSLVRLVDDADRTELHLRDTGGRTLELGWPSRAGDALALLSQLAATLADLHRVDVVHGRVTAEHVLVTDDQRPVLCGLADAGPAGTPTPPGLDDSAHPVGLPRRAALDVFGLGALLADALSTLDPPAGRAAQQERTRLRALAQRCMHPEADSRPSAADVADACARASIAAGSAARARPAPVAGATPVRAAVACAISALTAGALARLSQPGLPPLRPGAWQGWLTSSSTVTIALSLLQAVALGLAVYLVVATALALAATLSPSRRLHAVACRVVPRSMEQLAGIAVGAGLLAALVGELATSSGGGPLTAHASAATAPTTTVAPSPTTTTAAPRTTTAPATSSASLPATTTTGVRQATTAPPVTTTAAPPTTTASPRPATPAVGDTSSTRTHTVARGEHLWAIASDVLDESWGRTPSEREVVPYWRALVEANRDRLADPANPDLLFRGQELVLPTPPPRP